MNGIQLNANMKSNALQLGSQPARKPVRKNAASFGTQGSNGQYGNPVNKGMEYFSAAIFPAILTAAAGVGTYIAAKSESVIKEAPILKGKAGLATGIVAGAVGALTIIPALYHRSVSVFAKEREFDVYSRSKSAETSLSEQIDDKARNPEVQLDDAIGSYAKFNIARKGNGVGIMGM